MKMKSDSVKNIGNATPLRTYITKPEETEENAKKAGMQTKQDRSTPLVSVVIPVYNPPVSRLKACVNSILKTQAIPIEVILVDDGSNCEVLRCLDFLECENQNVRVIREVHRGVSEARNTGTKLAEGNYILYVDSDDEITPGSIEQGVEAIVSTSSDIAFGYVQRISSENEKLSLNCNELSQEKTTISIEDLLKYHLKGYVEDKRLCKEHNLLDVKIAPIARLIKREFAICCPFPERVAVSEDTVWNISLLLKCSRAVVVQSCWYWYWNVPNSTVRKYRRDSVNEAISSMKALRDVLGIKGMDEFRTEYLARCTGEINRIAKNYAKPECDIPKKEQLKNIRLAYNAMVSDYIKIGDIISAKDLILVAKLFLCRTGLNLIVFKHFP